MKKFFSISMKMLSGTKKKKKENKQKNPKAFMETVLVFKSETERKQLT